MKQHPTEPTNVVVFIAGRDPITEGGGGHTTYVRAHARAAIMAGYEPHIFCVSGRGLESATGFGVVHQIPSPFRRSRRLMQPELRDALVPWHAPLLTRTVISFLDTVPGARVIHAFSVVGSVGAEVARWFRRRGRKVTPVVSAYTTTANESEARVRAVRDAGGRRRLRYQLEHLWISLIVDRYERRAYAGAELVLVNYQSVQRLLAARYRLPVSRFRRLPYTSEAAFLCEEQPEPRAPAPIATLGAPGAPLVVTVSRHDPKKGVDILIRALGRVSAGGVPFRACLVGPGPLRGAHALLVEGLGLSNRVTVTGWVRDPRAYLRHADIYVLPSLEEGSGSLALIEAMQAGVAPIVSNVDGLPEDVTHGEDAVLVEPGDENGLAQALARLLRDEALRRRLGGRARETFLARFSAAAFARALGETYAELGVPPIIASTPGRQSAVEK